MTSSTQPRQTNTLIFVQTKIQQFQINDCLNKIKKSLKSLPDLREKFSHVYLQAYVAGLILDSRKQCKTLCIILDLCSLNMRHFIAEPKQHLL